MGFVRCVFVIYLFFCCRHEFENALCEPYPFECCHVVVECDIARPDSAPVKMLVRGEVDARTPTGKRKRKVKEKIKRKKNEETEK